MIGYNTEQDLQIYADARGVLLSQPPEQSLLRALDYIESRSYKGSKTDENQELQFPRDGNDDVHPNIVKAQLVAAMIYDDGGDPMAPVGQRVLSERVEGAVAVSYSDKGNQSTWYPHLSALLRPFLSAAGGTQFKVSRG